MIDLKVLFSLNITNARYKQASPNKLKNIKPKITADISK
jgi:hypothetical protein